MVLKHKQIITILELLGKKGTLTILEFLREAPKRYNELRGACSSDRTLSERLKQLEHNGLIETESIKSGSRFFVHYKSTEKGKVILENIKDIK